MSKKIIVTTSWDDGHKLDTRLAELLKKYEIKGTFYISPKNREFKKEDLLSDEEIVKLSSDFEIGAHTVTHPRLTRIHASEAFSEIADSKKYLEKLLGKEVRCFCYPGGKYNNEITKLVGKAGFYYARTMEKFKLCSVDDVLLSPAALEAHRNSLVTLLPDSLKILRFCGFNLMEYFRNLNWEYLAKKMFDSVETNGGIYHLWGHSWVLEKYHDWAKLEKVLSYISKKTNVRYCTNYGIARSVK